MLTDVTTNEVKYVSIINAHQIICMSAWNISEICQLHNQVTKLGCVNQLVSCLTANLLVKSLIPSQATDFAKIDCDIISVTILPFH